MQLDHNKLSPESLQLDRERQDELLHKRMSKDIEKESDVVFAEYTQTKTLWIFYKIVYPVLWFISVAMMVISNVFSSGIILKPVMSIAIVAAIISFLVLGRFMISQLMAQREMSYYMYIRAIKRFRIAAIICAVVVTLNFLLTLILILVMSNTQNITKSWINVIVLQALAVIMIWLITLFEKGRNVIIFGGRSENAK